MTRALVVALGLLVPAVGAARGGGKGLGLGLAIGSPTGINLKKTLGARTAVDGTLGLNFLNGDGFTLHACFLWEASLASASAGQFNGHLGLGGKLGVYDDDRGGRHKDDRDDDDDELWLGGRAPAGVSFAFRGVPLDVWLELAAVLWVVEEVDLDFDGTLGVRYWF